MTVNRGFWRSRRVLVTGNTGFKGAWLSAWLLALGADVHGLSVGIPTTPSLFDLAGLKADIPTAWIDVRDHEALERAVRDARPEVLVHMAAQPFVRRSFREPRETYEVNVMGTVNVLEAVRRGPQTRVVINVTSDKCYDNREQGRAFREDDAKGGHDPYSSSKGCAELVSDAYLRSFFAPEPDGPRLASGRAGNVIGGGDWGEDRLIPDIMRGALASGPIRIRNPEAVRPWQHVLNPLSGYLTLAQALWEDPAAAGGWNFGPDERDAQPVSHVVRRVTAGWPAELTWENDPGPHPHEARLLLLDSSKAREELGWRPTWGLDAGLDATVAWYAAYREGQEARATTLKQITQFEQEPLSG